MLLIFFYIFLFWKYILTSQEEFKSHKTKANIAFDSKNSWTI